MPSSDPPSRQAGWPGALGYEGPSRDLQEDGKHFKARYDATGKWDGD